MWRNIYKLNKLYDDVWTVVGKSESVLKCWRPLLMAEMDTERIVSSLPCPVGCPSDLGYPFPFPSPDAAVPCGQGHPLAGIWWHASPWPAAPPSSRRCVAGGICSQDEALGCPCRGRQWFCWRTESKKIYSEFDFKDYYMGKWFPWISTSGREPKIKDYQMGK